ncbi:MAG TPA: SDR family oxidoreductase [Chitinophagaceae bacterium]|nr:SDR family oxidoreductase [Chitinophagaceae bacterium]
MSSVLLTGGAGFIGSNLVRVFLEDSRIKKVRILDNFSTGFHENLEELRTHPRLEIITGDICDFETCRQAMTGMELVCHQAALGSVPRSIAHPLATHESNVNGTLHIYEAARQAGIRRIVYAASSSTYGDSTSLPKVEDQIGKPLSPYAVTKYVMELYADVYARVYGMEFIGLRYFNVFGPRQSPKGAYAAVIPIFMQAMLSGQSPVINGDGSFSRDFTFIDNVIDANLKALFCTDTRALNQVYNIAYGESTTLLQLFEMIRELSGSTLQPQLGPSRNGDIPHSLASIEKAKQLLGYEPRVSIREGLARAFSWYQKQYQSQMTSVS